MTTSFPRSLLVAAATGAMTAAAPAAAFAGSITVNGKQKDHGAVWATYTSSKGSFKATAVERHKLKVTGRIHGKKFRGTVRTHQAGGGRFAAKGSGRLGGRKVRITGGGPNSLKSVKLILRW